MTTEQTVIPLIFEAQIAGVEQVEAAVKDIVANVEAATRAAQQSTTAITTIPTTSIEPSRPQSPPDSSPVVIEPQETDVEIASPNTDIAETGIQSLRATARDFMGQLELLSKSTNEFISSVGDLFQNIFTTSRRLIKSVALIGLAFGAISVGVVAATQVFSRFRSGIFRIQQSTIALRAQFALLGLSAGGASNAINNLLEVGGLRTITSLNNLGRETTALFATYTDEQQAQVLTVRDALALAGLSFDDALDAAIELSLDNIEEFNTITAVTTAALPELEEVLNTTGGGFERVAAVGEVLTERFGTLENANYDLIVALDGLTTAWAVLLAGATPIATGLVNLITKVLESFTGLVRWVANNFGNIAIAIAGGIAQVLVSFLPFIAIGSLALSVWRIWGTDIINFFSNTWTSITTAVTSFWTGFTSIFTLNQADILTELIAWAKRLLDSIGLSFDDLVNLARDFGRRMIDGIIDGFAGIGTKLTMRIRNIAKNAFNSFAEGLGGLIGQSPSPLGIKVGEDFASGLRMGLRDINGVSAGINTPNVSVSVGDSTTNLIIDGRIITETVARRLGQQTRMVR